MRAQAGLPSTTAGAISEPSDYSQPALEPPAPNRKHQSLGHRQRLLRGSQEKALTKPAKRDTERAELSFHPSGRTPTE